MFKIENPRFRTGRELIFTPINEVWIDINIPNIRPIYMISNFGRIYSKLNNCLLKTNIINSGYVRVTLKNIDNGQKDFLVHRLVMICFNPINNYEEFQVNHKDGIKTNNYIENLEWCTQSENIIHAYKIGLYKNGENNNFAILTENQVHLICQGLCERLSYQDICTKKLGIEYTKQMKSTIGAIRNKINWKHISSLYNIPTAGRNDQYFSDEQIHNICKMMELNISTKDIISAMNIDINNMSKKEIQNIREIINRIRRRERFQRISQHYNF